jgi:hypothetical protein
MYVCLNIIWNSILYIGFTYMYVSRIIFCMVLNTWLHTKLLYEGLDNVFALPNLQTPSFKYSQVVFAPLQNFVLMFFQCKLLFTIDSQNSSSFDFIKWEILLLPWSHLKLGPEHKMIYNSLSATPNSLRF